MKTMWWEFRRWLREPNVIWRRDTDTMQVTIEVQHWVLVIVFLVTFFWYVSSPSPVAMMSTVAFGGVLLSAFLWARTMAISTRGERRLRFAAMQVGDELEEEISLRNPTPVPVIWAEFIDRSSIPGYTVSSARAVDAHSHLSWRAHTVCTRRGVYNLGPWEMRIGEPFGLLLVRQLYLQRQEILVYPPLASLPEHILPHRGALGDHRPLNQPLRAETISSYSTRAYVPGDPLRHIHWSTTARHNQPFVKVFAPEAASNIWLVPDFNAASHVGAGDLSSEEVMVTVIASLAAELLQQHLAVGMFASAEKEAVVLPRQGQPHLWNILQSIAPLHAIPGHSLEDILKRALPLISGNDLLILVTPSLDSSWLGALRRISRSRGSLGRSEVVLLDPASFTQLPLEDGSNPAAVSRQAEDFAALLMEQGLVTNILRRDDVRLISGYYGELSRWEFTVLGTGRAVARRAPRSANDPQAQIRVNGAEPVSMRARE